MVAIKMYLWLLCLIRATKTQMMMMTMMPKRTIIDCLVITCIWFGTATLSGRTAAANAFVVPPSSGIIMLRPMMPSVRTIARDLAISVGDIRPPSPHLFLQKQHSQQQQQGRIVSCSNNRQTVRTNTKSSTALQLFAGGATAAAATSVGTSSATGGTRLWIISSIVVKMLVVFGICLGLSFRYPQLPRRYLWPGLRPDPNRWEPLPPTGLLGWCPWWGGANTDQGSHQEGPECRFRQTAQRLSDPLLQRQRQPQLVQHVWMWYSRRHRKPVASISSVPAIEQVSNMEFQKLTTPTTATSDGSNWIRQLWGHHNNKQQQEPTRSTTTTSVVSEDDPHRHARVRRAIGDALTSPHALHTAMPTLQVVAHDAIRNGLLVMMRQTKNHNVHESVSVEYSLSVMMHVVMGWPFPATVTDRSLLHSWWRANNDKTCVKNNKKKKVRFWTRGRRRGVHSVGDDDKRMASRIAAHMARLQQGKTTAQSKQSSVLSRMLSSSSDATLQPKEVGSNILQLIQSGVEPSAGVLTMALLLLGIHNRDKYQTLVKEQLAVRDLHGPELTVEQLDEQNSPYLNAVVKEALRMGASTGSRSVRKVTDTILVHGKQIPKGWLVQTNYRLTHEMDPFCNHPDGTMGHMDPYRGFEPERWLHPETTPTEFIPFGAGPRSCVGAPLATLQIKVFLAVLARTVASFHVLHNATANSTSESSVDWNPEPTMIPLPMDGLQIDVVKLHKPT